MIDHARDSISLVSAFGGLRLSAVEEDVEARWNFVTSNSKALNGQLTAVTEYPRFRAERRVVQDRCGHRRHRECNIFRSCGTRFDKSYGR
jgi:hypothetical protein